MAIDSDDGVNLDVGVTILAVANAAAGGVAVTDTDGGMTVGSVTTASGSISGVSTVGGGITLVGNSPLTIDQPVSDTGGGSIALTASSSSSGGTGLYFADSGLQKIRKVNTDGSGLTDILTGLSGPSGVDVDVANGHVYWTDFGTNKIQRADVSGLNQNVEDLVSTGVTTPRDIALDLTNGKMYWSDTGPSTGADGNESIKRANLNGSNVETILDADAIHGDPFGLALDVPNGHLYWADDGIWRANLDGSGVIRIVGNLNVQGIALDSTAGKIYLMNSADNTIKRVDLDGSNLETVVKPRDRRCQSSSVASLI